MQPLYCRLAGIMALLLFACQPKTPPAAVCNSFYMQADTIQQLTDNGDIPAALQRALALKDSIDHSCDINTLKVQAAIKVADMQNLQMLYLRKGFDTAALYAARLLALPVQEDSIQAHIYNTVGFYYYIISLVNNTNRIDSAVQLLTDAATLYNKSGQLLGAADAYFNLGLCLQNNPDTARNNLDSSMYYLRQSAELSSGEDGQRVHSYASRHISAVFMERHQYDSALYYAQESWQLRKAVGIRSLYPFSLLLVGDIHKLLQQPDSAFHYHRLAANYADTLNNPVSVTAAYIALGDDLADQEQVAEARRYYEQAGARATMLGFAEGQEMAAEKIAGLSK